MRLNRKDKDEDDLELDLELPLGEGSPEDTSPQVATDSDEPPDTTSSDAFMPDREYDDHILAGQSKTIKNFSSKDQVVVEGVSLEKKPKLMAEAIKHLLDQDKD